jgi:hypothetical protein
MKPLHTFDRNLFLIASAVVGGYLLIYCAYSVVNDVASRPAATANDEISKLSAEDPIVPPGTVEDAAEREVPIPNLNVDHYCRLRAARDEILPLPHAEPRDTTALYNKCFDQQQVSYNSVKRYWATFSRPARELCSAISLKSARDKSLLVTSDLYYGLDKCLANRRAEEMAADINPKVMQDPPRRELQR